MKSYKNYFIVGGIYLVTILGVFYFISLYDKVNSFNYDSSLDMFILDSSYDKMFSNISNFSYENDSFVVFYSLSGVSNDLKRFMVQYDVTHSFLYLDDFSYLTRLLSDYSYDYSVYKDKNYFVYFSLGKVSSVVDCSNFSYDDYFNYFKEVGLV